MLVGIEIDTDQGDHKTHGKTGEKFADRQPRQRKRPRRVGNAHRKAKDPHCQERPTDLADQIQPQQGRHQHKADQQPKDQAGIKLFATNNIGILLVICGINRVGIIVIIIQHIDGHIKQQHGHKKERHQAPIHTVKIVITQAQAQECGQYTGRFGLNLN